MKDLYDIASPPKPTAERPLLGATVLVVEDSRYACEAVRLMCLRSGARIRRADTLRAASRHLQTYLPSVVIVDLGLPDGSGLALISELVDAVPRLPVILGTSGDVQAREAALSHGADGFLAKPLTSLARFQTAILSRLPRDQQPPSPRAIPTEVIAPDALSLRDDMAHVADLLTQDTGEEMLDYVTQFLGGIALSCGDRELQSLTNRLRDRNSGSRQAQTDINDLRQLVGDRMELVPAI